MDYKEVLLVLPPMYQTGRMPDYNPKEPMGLMCLASYLRKHGIGVEILDADIMALSVERSVAEITRRNPRVIGFSIMQRALPTAKKVIEGVRERLPGSHICCGGITATMSPEKVLRGISAVDSVVVGEGEETFRKLSSMILSGTDWKSVTGIAYLKNGEYVLNGGALKPFLGALPWPSRDLLPICHREAGYATIMASRGCYGNCTFCSNNSFERVMNGPKWRNRIASDVVDEMAGLIDVYGVRTFKFNDPNLFGPGASGRRHVVDLCEEIISRDLGPLHLMGFCRSNDLDSAVSLLMRRAGFERILIGIESSCPEILKTFRKGESIETIRRSLHLLQSVGISIVPGFMMFNPYTTFESLESDILFLKETAFTPVLAKSLRVFDGTPIQEVLEAEGRLVERDPFDGYHEYLVDRRIAAIYMSLKVLSLGWVEPLKKANQKALWQIKKSSSFSERLDFDALGHRHFALERDALKKFVLWSRQGFRHSEIAEFLRKTRMEISSIGDFIASVSCGDYRDVSEDMSSDSVMADRIGTLLSEQKHETFPEKYRWYDD